MHGSQNDGLKVSLRSIERLEVRFSTLSESNRGIVLEDFTGKINIENTSVLRSVGDGVWVRTDSTKTIRIHNSSILHSGGWALHMYGNYFSVEMSVSSCIFGWNKGGVLRAFQNYDRVNAMASFVSNTFLLNRGTVVDLSKLTYSTLWIFERNRFVNNTGPSVIQTPPHVGSYYSPKIFVKDNTFTLNKCGSKCVICINGDAHTTSVNGNLFDRNVGRVIVVQGSVNSNPLSVTGNTFERNDGEDNGIVEVLRMDRKVLITNNTFLSNKGRYVVRLQAAYNINQQTVKQNISFVNNYLVANCITSSAFSCVINISGLLTHKELNFSKNQFSNPDFPKDLCLNLLARSEKDVVDVTENWWGSNKTRVVASRILHFDDNYDYVVADFTPFLWKRNKPISIADGHDWSADKLLRGRVFTPCNLTSSNSPYVVTSDLTILPGVTVKIDPGVELQFSPGVGLLVLGTLIARGKPTKRVKFTVLKEEALNKDVQIPIRLTGGDFPWVGQLDVFYNKSWMPICIPGNVPWKVQNLKVVCRQLGYGEHSITETFVLKDSTTGDMGFPFGLNCIGNESKLEECAMTHGHFNCSIMKLLQLRCGGKPWGNVRFVRHENTVKSSVLEHVEIEYCGNRHGKNVYALEAVMTSPVIDSLLISNCSSGGLKVFSPEDTVKVAKSSFRNLKKSGVQVLQTHHSILFQDSTSLNNEHGIIFEESSHDNTPSIHYGRVALCSSVTKINFTESQVSKQLLSFFVPHITGTSPSTRCQMILGGNVAFKMRLIFQEGSQSIQVFNKHGGEVMHTGSSYGSVQLSRLKEGTFLPWDSIKVVWNGYFTSQVLLSVETANMSCK